MKQSTLILTLVLTSGLAVTALVFSACNTGKQSATPIDSAALTTSHFRVEGMTCVSCEYAVKAAVERLDGIARVEASTADSQATVSYDSSTVTQEAIAAAITKLGYQTVPLPEEGSTTTTEARSN